MARAKYYTGDADADALVATDPLALLIAMVLDQQVPLEWAFRGPLELQERLKKPLDAKSIARMDPAKFTELFTRKPSIHRYPGSMATRVQDLCRIVADEYGGDAARVWTDASSGTDAYDRIRALPGFGDMKARITVALLGKQFGLKAAGWREASTPFGDPGTTYSVADIVDPTSFDKVRETKTALKALAKAGAPAKTKKAAATRPAAEAQRGEGGLSEAVSTTLADRRLYLCTPDRPDLAKFLSRRASRGASTWCNCETDSSATSRSSNGRASPAGSARTSGSRSS